MSGFFGVVVKTAPGETAPNSRNGAELRGVCLRKPCRFTRSPATTNLQAAGSSAPTRSATASVRPCTTIAGDPVNHFDPDGRCPNSNPIAPPFPPIPTPIPAPTPNPPPVVNYPAPNPAPTNYPTPVPAPPPDPTIGGQNPSDPNNDPSIFAGVPTAAVRGLAGFANRWTGGLFGSFGADPTSSEFQAGKTVGTYTAATAAVVGVAYVAATYGAAIVARGVITALPYLPAAVEVAPATEVAIASVEGAEGVGLAGEEIAGSAVEETSAAAEEASAGAAAPPQ